MPKSDTPTNQMAKIQLKGRSYTLNKLIDENEIYEIWQGVRSIFTDSIDSKSNSRLYRIYLLKPSPINNLAEIEAAKDEIRLLSYIYHKNCPYVEDAGEINSSNGRTIFFTEHWWDGISLREVLSRIKSYNSEKSRFYIPIGVSLWTIREVAAALDHIHNLKNEKGEPLKIIHRNLRPETVYYTNEGSVLLCGFSTSKSNINLYHTNAGEIRGISPYMPPERIFAPDSYDGIKADIFSLGCTLFEMLTGIPRMKTSSSGLPNFETLKRNINLQSIRNTIHPKLEQLINTMTHYDPAKRYNSVEEIIYRLDLLLDASPYRCFASDVSGFVKYIINNSNENYFCIQKLIEREKKLLKKERIATTKNMVNKCHSANIPAIAKLEKSSPVPHPNPIINSPAAPKQQEHPKINAEQWTEIQKKLDSIMEENKTKKIDKSKMLVFCGIFILFLSFILISLLLMGFYKNSFSRINVNKSPAAISSSNISAPLIEDNLTVNPEYLERESGSLIMEIIVFDNGSIATNIKSIDGAFPNAESKLIHEAFKKLNTIDWKPYTGRTLLYKFYFKKKEN